MNNNIYYWLLTLDVLEFPCAGWLDEVEFFGFFRQWRENQGEAQLLVRPGYRGSGRTDGDVINTCQLQFATLVALDIDFAIHAELGIRPTGLKLHLYASLLLGASHTQYIGARRILLVDKQADG